MQRKLHNRYKGAFAEGHKYIVFIFIGLAAATFCLQKLNRYLEVKVRNATSQPATQP